MQRIWAISLLTVKAAFRFRLVQESGPDKSDKLVVFAAMRRVHAV
jgi:hypothetical protein